MQAVSWFQGKPDTPCDCRLKREGIPTLTHLMEAQGLVQDPLQDDLSVIIPTENGLFVILGCAHAGIVNTLNFAMKRMNEDRIHTVFGGTHLGPVGEEQREESINALKTMKIAHWGVSHCTGMKTSVRLAQEWGDRFVFCSVGTVFQG
jgi:7,8-dihydropterin-6-yl-methyl-4-(beta-D-ribofuranosyl)aminobenzene 5'-phosphate synthase